VSRSRRALIAAACVATGVLLAGCPTSFVKPDDPINAQLATFEERLAKIERVVNNQSLLELAQQVEGLRAEVAELRGQLETVEHAASGSAERSKQLFVDLDSRLRAVEAGATATAVAGATAAGSGEQGAYDAAFELLKQSRYEQARAGFAALLKNYPNGKLRDNAQFWLAETWYVTKGFKQALAEFDKVIKGYPDSNKLADSWLKVGYCQHELGNVEAARKAFATVTEQYPESDAAKRALARLKQLSEAKK
jgi:tol-pal system protein YbgF